MGIVKRLKGIPALALLMDDRLQRKHATSWATAIFDIGYGLITLVSGIVYGSWWSAAVGIYYAAMVAMALRFGFGIRKASRMEPGPERTAEELRVYWDSAWALLAFNVTLTGVAYQMIHRGLSWSYPTYVIYGVAAFAFGNLVVAIVGIARGGKRDAYIDQAISSVNLAKAIVGMFFLTTALLVEFGGEADSFRITMESAVGAVCMPAVVVIALRMLWKAYRAKRTLTSA